MITLKDLVLWRGSQCLLDAANLQIFRNQKIGIVGRNGSGKSSLFALLRGEIQEDSGDVTFPSDMEIAHVQQETPALSCSALDYVMQGDEKTHALLKATAEAEAAVDVEAIADCHAKLAGCDGYTLESRAAKILCGLGFSDAELNKAVSEFSGGWRMRMNLAQALIKPADLLLLDEPTNHLDFEAIVWLEAWLKQRITVLLISHDRSFLDNTVSHICTLRGKKLKLYTGNYSAYEKTYAEELRLHEKMRQKHEQKRAHMMSFVNRFRAKASKAKQAQSRLKAIEKMGTLAELAVDSDYNITFPVVEALPYPMLSIHQGEFSYGDNKVLSQVNLQLGPGSRLGLLGVNGAGKSTLIKLIAGELAFNSGEYTRHKQLRVGYFAQHQIDDLDLTASAFQHLQALAPTLREQELWNYLGRFNFDRDLAQKPLGTCSGGERTRLALALLVWQKPNLLLLDEPTNHLDMDMRDALVLALQEYAGALIVVSHDKYLLNCVVDEFYKISQQRVKSFIGSLDDYAQEVKAEQAQQKEQGVAVVAQSKTMNHEQRRLLKSQLTKLEKQLMQASAALEAVRLKLGDVALYEADKQQELMRYSKEAKQLEKKVQELEEKWLEMQADLDLE